MSPLQETQDLPRVLGDKGPRGSGPTLICIGGLHGNEPAGVFALQRVFARLGEGSDALQGRLIGLVGNRRALESGERFIAHDLNRLWSRTNIERARVSSELDAESEELRELARELDDCLESTRGPVFCLDLHTTSGEAPAFAILDDTLANRSFAFELPVPHVLGVEEELSGTLVGYLNERAHAAIGFESGGHGDPGSVERAEAAVWVAMEAAGLLQSGARGDVARSRQLLASASAPLPGVVEILYRHAVHPRNEFAMRPGFRSFDPVRAGQTLADERSGPVVAPVKGLILMPLYQGQGEDGFFIVGRVRSFWLQLSAWLRRLRVDRCAHWLPGVSRDPQHAHSYLVDRRRARWLAREFFHLLGYKRIARTETSLVMRRRDAGSD